MPQSVLVVVSMLGAVPKQLDGLSSEREVRGLEVIWVQRRYPLTELQTALHKKVFDLRFSLPTNYKIKICSRLNSAETQLEVELLPCVM